MLQCSGPNERPGRPAEPREPEYGARPFVGPQLCDGALQCLQDRVSIRLSDLSLELALPEPGRIDTQEGKGVLQLLEEVLHQEDEVLM